MRIAWVASIFEHWKPISPEALTDATRMIGGGETAVIELTGELGKLGHEVHVYAHTPYKKKRYDNVTWHSHEQWKEDRLRKWDVAVACEAPVLLLGSNATLKILHCQLNHPIIPEECIPEINAYVGVSRWHAASMVEDNPILAKPGAGRVIYISEGISLDYLKGTGNTKTKNTEHEPYRVMYASSPDRGGHHLFYIWPLIRQKLPSAQLHLYYNPLPFCEETRWIMNETGWRSLLMYRLMEMPGVTAHGALDKYTLAAETKRASLLIHPCDTILPSEGYSMTVLQANAAGTPALITDCDALGEVHSRFCPTLRMPVEHAKFAETAVELLTQPSVWRKYSRLGLQRMSEATWDVIAPQWAQLFEEGLAHVRSIRNTGS